MNLTENVMLRLQGEYHSNSYKVKILTKQKADGFQFSVTPSCLGNLKTSKSLITGMTFLTELSEVYFIKQIFDQNL